MMEIRGYDSMCCRSRAVLLCFLLCASWNSALGQKPKAGGDGDQPGSDLDATNAVLISKYMAQTGNEAYYTGDKTEIDKLVRLFRNNRSIPYACGYHWLIWFSRSPTEAVPISYNEECGTFEAHNKEIRSTLKRCFDAIRKKPKSFISNLRVTAAVPPEEVFKELEDSRHHVFFFNGLLERLPSIKGDSSLGDAVAFLLCGSTGV
jgi:hypothetical protein